MPEVPTFPDDDTTRLPPAGLPGPLGGVAVPADPAELRRIDERILEDTRAIVDPADRSLAFDRVARAKILYDSWEQAQEAIIEGGRAAVQVPDPLVRDSRLMALVTTSITLAEDLVREGTVEESLAATPDDSRPTRSLESRLQSLRRARQVASFAGDLAARIGNLNFQSYTLAQLAENQGINAQAVARSSWLMSSHADEGQDSQAPVSLREMAGSVLAEAVSLSWRIPFPIWRDQSLVRVVGSAAAAGQYDRAMYERGLTTARRIPDPEARADALIRLADAEARSGAQDLATSTYREAVTAVASIPLPDPRVTFGGILMDSLLAVGRFKDARATALLVQDPQLRLRALGAVARSMGERGLVEKAAEWIDGEPDQVVRDRLRRELNEGVDLWIQKYRSNSQGLNPLPDAGTTPGVEGMFPNTDATP
jgi:hypothetical protein